MNMLWVAFFILLQTVFLDTKVYGFNTEEIVGGIPTPKGRFRYVIALMYKLPGYPDMNPCTGSIVGNFHVITIADCFYSRALGGFINKFFYIAAGMSDLLEITEYTRYIGVDTVTIPKSYNPNTTEMRTVHYTDGNIAIVKLHESLGLIPHHPALSELALRLKELKNLNTVFFVAGYGFKESEIVIEETNGKIDYIQVGNADGKLRYAKAKIIPNQNCQDLIKDYIAPGNFCAKVIKTKDINPAGICTGDSGAPLVHGLEIYGVAIHSFVACDEEQMPGIYVNISYHRSFILNVMVGGKSNDMYILQLQPRPQDQFEFVQI